MYDTYVEPGYKVSRLRVDPKFPKALFTFKYSKI
jgi:hypothetical protein